MNTYQNVVLFLVGFLTLISAIGMTILCTYVWIHIMKEMFEDLRDNYREQQKKKKNTVDVRFKNRPREDDHWDESFLECLSQRKNLEELLNRHPNLKIKYLAFMKHRNKKRE